MIQSVKVRVKTALENGEGGITTVMCGASLSHHGLLGSLPLMMLYDVDLSQVPDKDLASLASCVTVGLKIRDVTGGQQIATLMTNLKCNRLGLYISRQSLGQGGTQALVQAMESSVKVVTLYGEVSLEMEALSEYNGHGECSAVRLWGDTAARYKEDLRKWAGNRNWRVTVDTDKKFFIVY